MENRIIKWLWALSLGLLTACSCSNHQMDGSALKLSDNQADDKAIQLYHKLQKNLDKGIMLGHQDELAYGYRWFMEAGRSDVKSVCGDYPAVVGWDLGGLETGSRTNCDSIPFSALKGYVRQVEQQGGISIFTWRAGNPVGEENAGGSTRQDVVKQIVENDAAQQRFLASLDKVASFFTELKDEEGKPISVIFQPFQSITADSAMWWTPARCSANDFKKLWSLTVDYLRNKKGVHNLLYAYSIGNERTAETLQTYYPGNSRVDIVGLNALLLQKDSCDTQTFIQQFNRNIAIITQFAEKNKKVPAITYTGLESVKVSDFFSQDLYPVISQYKLSFVMFGANAWNQEEHYFIPVPGHPASDDFVRFASYPDILTSNDIKE